MAIKDLSPSVVADILVLLKQARDYGNSIASNKRGSKPSRYNKEGPPFSVATGIDDAVNSFQTWYNTYIKNNAPEAGTATISSKFDAAAWKNTFFQVRSSLISVALPGDKIISDLDLVWAVFQKINGFWRFGK